MKKSISLVILISILSASLTGAENYEEISRNYDRIVSPWLNEEISDESTINGLSNLEKTVDAMDDERDRFYWFSKIHLMKGFIWLRAGEEEKSITELENSREMATKSMEFSEYSEGWRLLSEAGSYIMLQKGVGYIIANSGKIQEQAEKSLLIDPQNNRAAFIVAQGLMNAPRLFGGDKKKGLEELERLSKNFELGDESRYFIMTALSDAYVALERNDDAIRNYRMLLSQFPGSTYLEEKLREIQ